MANSLKILRTSVHSFFCNYQTFASLATALIFPFSAATLLSPSLFPSSSSPISGRIHSLVKAANFPPSSGLFDILELKLSQTIISFLFSLPFTLTFLPLSQASIISSAANHRLRGRSSILRLYPPLLLTRLFTTLIILAANVAFFSLFLVVGELGISSKTSLFVLGALASIAYSTITANVVVICNLAGVVSAMENCSGCAAVLKACVLVRGRASAALSLALCSNLAMAATEALFQMRVMRIYDKNGIFLDLALLFEAATIIYIYSIFRVLDIIISCCFYRSCRYELMVKYDGRVDGVGDFDVGEKSDLNV